MDNCCKRGYWCLEHKYGFITMFECYECRKLNVLDKEEKKELMKNEPPELRRYTKRRKERNEEIIG